MKKSYFKICTAILFLLLTAYQPICANWPESLGLRGPIVKVEKDEIHLKVAFDEIILDGGFRYSFSDNNNTYVELSPHASSEATIITLAVSMKDVLPDYKDHPATVLPGGRDFPGIFTEGMPIKAFEIKDSNGLIIYIGSELICIFIPVDIGIDQSIATFRLRSDKERIGNISLVGKDSNSKNSGFFILLNTKGYMEEVIKFAEDRDI